MNPTHTAPAETCGPQTPQHKATISHIRWTVLVLAFLLCLMASDAFAGSTPQPPASARPAVLSAP